MKTKEIVQLIVALVIFAIASYLIYLQLAPKQKASDKKGPMVEVITPVPAEYNQSALDKLSDSSKHRDFYTVPDLKNGVGNPQPFGTSQ